MSKTAFDASARLRGAVFGYGFISSAGHVPAYLSRARTRGDVDIVAIADICPARRELAAAAVPGVRVYDTPEALLDAEGNRLDFVDVATPPAEHARLAHMALTRGLHVLCEKPLTTDPNEATQLLAHARLVKRVVFPCHNYKHAPVVKAIRSAIESGKIGAVHSVTLDTFRATHARGVPEWQPDWRRDLRWSGGGIGMDHGSHTFYLAFEWLQGYPLAVSARTFNRQPGRWNTEDTLTAVVRFPAGTATVHLTWTAGVRKVLYTLHGDQGALTIDDDDVQLAVMADETRPPAQWNFEHSSIASDWMDPSHVGWFDGLFDEFRGAIARDDYVSREALDAYWCVQLIAAAYRSAREQGREIALDGTIALPLAG